LHGTPIPHTYQHYTISFVATSSASFISFAFREDPGFFGLDDVSVTSGGGSNLIVNGDFESGPIGGSAPSGWTYLNEFAATFSGEVAGYTSPFPHSGICYYYDGSVQAYDVITQQIPTTIGHTYDIGFWLIDSSGLTTFQRLSDNGQPDTLGNGVNLVVYAGDGQPFWSSGLDACIGHIFEPGNIATDSGAFTRPRYPVTADIVEAVTAADLASASVPGVFAAAVAEAAAATDTQSASASSAVIRSAAIAGLSLMRVNSGVPPIKSSRLSSGTALGA
jgi:hypothetical protein